LVEEFDARSRREVASRRRFLTEMDRLADPFDRAADPVHVTGSAIITGSRGTVLHLHKRLRLWLQPGGHIDAGETPWDAAVRETKEETGLLGRHPEGGPCLFHLDAHPAGDHFHLDLRYLLYCDDADPSPGPEESPEVRWFGLDETLGMADAGLVDGLRRLKRLEP
jgi:8-oxo-dGTP pyrophosphatase MutT (NUDIX family)